MKLLYISAAIAAVSLLLTAVGMGTDYWSESDITTVIGQVKSNQGLFECHTNSALSCVDWISMSSL